MSTKNKQQEKTDMMIALPISAFVALSSAITFGAAPSINAASSGGTAQVSVTVGSVISVGTQKIEFALDSPSPAGSFASGTGQIKVTTNDIAGYSVYLTSDSATTSLNHESLSSAKIDSITSIQTINASNTIFSDGSTKSTWGWSKDGATYYPVTPVGTKSTAELPTLYRKTTSHATAGDTSTLTIGVTGNSHLPSGQYTGTLLLTAITNSSAAELQTFDATL